MPVLFSDDSPEQILTPIKGGTWYVIDTARGYEELYRRLTRQPSSVRPALGVIRALPARRRTWTRAQLEATTAPAPSAGKSVEDGTVAAIGNRSVAIGGNMISSTAIFGHHNVTHVTTASDDNEVRRNLQEFSQAAECTTIIGQICAEESKTRKRRANIVFCLVALSLL